MKYLVMKILYVIVNIAKYKMGIQLKITAAIDGI